jgi:dephospho-CoA kinase
LLRVGLTGGLACGKTTVGNIFRELGARVIEADSVAHELMVPGSKVYEEIVQHFGPGVLRPDATLDRRRLAEAAFGHGRIEELNRIVHPAVIARQEDWLRQVEQAEPQAVAVVEAALLLEAGMGRRFDKLVVVTCRPEQKAARFAQRQGLDLATAEAEVKRRQAAQWPDSEKIAAADYVIDNSAGLEELRLQVQQIYPKLKALAEAPTQPNLLPNREIPPIQGPAGGKP